VCVCVCECVGSRFSPPSVSFGRNKKITVTEERSHGWMKTLLWQSPAVSWKHYSDKSPAVSWKDEKFTVTKSSRPINGCKI
jgi:hypothetical protein